MGSSYFSALSTSSLQSVLILFLIVVFCLLSLVSSHATLAYPTARTGQAVGNGIKIPSLPVPANITCGGAAAADPGPQSVVATFNAGETISVQWIIHIPHTSAPGVQIAVQYSAQDSFSNNLLISGVDVQSNLNSTTNTAQVNVTLPANKGSNSAVLQWIWATTADGGYYVGCSDIKIVTGGTPAQSSEAFAIRYSMAVLAVLVIALVAAFLYE